MEEMFRNRFKILVFGGFILIILTVFKVHNPSNFNHDKLLNREKIKIKADVPEMIGIISKELRTKLGDDEPKYKDNYIVEEFMKAKFRTSKKLQARYGKELSFIERGPGNIAGRTRALIIDPDDITYNTWFAGSASGGIWKTTDGGNNWSYISNDIPNLGTNSLAMSRANTQVIYAGTGEHFTEKY